MNIFFLSKCPKRSARYQCDKHVVKMILESIQMLYCAHWILSNGEFVNDSVFEDETILKPYKKTHMNHPCNIWLRESYENYNWLCIHALELCKEYTRRYEGRVHKSEKHMVWLKENNPCPKDISFTIPPQAMPDEYKVNKRTFTSTVIAYRKYYRGDKERFAKWKDGNVPKWFFKDSKRVMSSLMVITRENIVENDIEYKEENIPVEIREYLDDVF